MPALRRDLTAQSAQFLSRDPAVSLTRSPYAYVAGNPLNATDPSGACLTGLPACPDSSYPAFGGWRLPDTRNTPRTFTGSTWMFIDGYLALGESTPDTNGISVRAIFPGITDQNAYVAPSFSGGNGLQVVGLDQPCSGASLLRPRPSDPAQVLQLLNSGGAYVSTSDYFAQLVAHQAPGPDTSKELISEGVEELIFTLLETGYGAIA